MRTFILLIAMLPALAMQGQGKNIESLEVRTTAVCDMCVTTIEGEMIYEKGVKKVNLDLASNIIHVDYDTRKTTPEDIRTAITKLGYSADEQPGDPQAFAKLPACCQKEGCGKVTAPAEGTEQTP